MGGVYTLGISPGTSVSHNVIHDVDSYNRHGAGAGACTTTRARPASAWRTTWSTTRRPAATTSTTARTTSSANNILAFSRYGQVMRTRAEPHLSFTLERQHRDLEGRAAPDGRLVGPELRLDNNLYFETAGQTVAFAGATLDEWRKRTGQDQHSRVADPGFVDAEGRDFRLQRPGRPRGPARLPAVRLRQGRRVRRSGVDQGTAGSPRPIRPRAPAGRVTAPENCADLLAKPEGLKVCYQGSTDPLTVVMCPLSGFIFRSGSHEQSFHLVRRRLDGIVVPQLSGSARDRSDHAALGSGAWPGRPARDATTPSESRSAAPGRPPTSTRSSPAGAGPCSGITVSACPGVRCPAPARPAPGRVPLPASSAPSVVQTLEQWGLLPGLFDLSPPVANAPRDDETLSHLPAEPRASSTLPDSRPDPRHLFGRIAPGPATGLRPPRMGCLCTRQSPA